MFYKKYKNIHYVQQVPEPWWLEAAGSVESRAVCTLLQKPPVIIVLVLKLHCIKNPIFVFPEKELCGLSPNFHIHVPVSDLYIPTNDLPILLQGIMWTDHGNI